jgi:DNA-directed RNA polymerase specialized sigma24 family protein
MAASPGRDDPTDVALPQVYEELRRLAHFALRREADGHSLSTTALVHEAYLRLTPQQNAQVVECRFFGGLTEDETAEGLGVSARTVKRDWAKARSWLYGELYPDTVD